MNLTGQKEKLQAALAKIFKNFINFEDRHLRMQETNLNNKLTKRYFHKYRKNVKDIIYG